MFSVDSPSAHGVTMATACSTLQSLIVLWWLTLVSSTLDVISSLGARTTVVHPTRLTTFWSGRDGQAPYVTLDPIGVQIRAVRMDQIIHLSAQTSVYDCKQENQPRSRNELTSPIRSYVRVSISGWNFTIGSLSSSQDQTLNQKLNGRPSNLPSSKRHIPILASPVIDIGTGLPGETLQLAEKARVARLTGAANFRDWWRCTSHSIRADRNAHWRAFTEET